MIMRSLCTVLAVAFGMSTNGVEGFTPLASPPKTTKLFLAKEESTDETNERIESLIQGNKVVLFMKGTKFFPQCGFSDTATKILEALEADYEAVDVLSDESIRQGIKEYSQWPTIPQLYINQEFIGGSDIMINMFESGELKEVLLEGEESSDLPFLNEEQVEVVLDTVRPFLKVGGGSIDCHRIEEGEPATIVLEMKGSSAALNSVKSEISERLQRHFMNTGLKVDWV